METKIGRQVLGNRVARGRALAKAALLACMLGVTILRDLLRIRRRKRHTVDKAAHGNIVIVGAGLANKGAQAMLFTTVDQMRRRFPSKDIYLLSFGGGQAAASGETNYRFVVLSWDNRTKMELLGVPRGLLRKMLDGGGVGRDYQNVRRIIESAHYFVDVSGYALSSEWSFGGSLSYLLNIAIAKRFSVAYYILPQSMGPFNYSLLEKLILYPLMRLYLPYPEKVFVREDDGLRCVRKFTRKNVDRAHDIVLTNPGYDMANIYVEQVEFRHIAIARGSVAVIPNERVLERTSRDAFNLLYCSVIRRLLLAQKTIYLLRHSYEDLAIIEELGRFFWDEARVQVIRDDMSAIEFERLVGQFDFIVASRYHAIVHAYKRGVPALVIGWAAKYLELLGAFGQQDYCVDIRSRPEVEEVTSKVDKLLLRCKHESREISGALAKLQAHSVFDAVGPR